MSREEANTYASGNGQSYEKFDYETQQKWRGEFEKATTLSDVERIANRMEQAGIDPAIVASWYDDYAKKFEEPQPRNPTWLTGNSGAFGYGNVPYTYNIPMTQ